MRTWQFFFSYEGRFSRMQWWLAQAAIVAYQLFFFISLNAYEIPIQELNGAAILLAWLLVAVCIWVNIATSAKRFHDRGKSGGWIMMNFVPVIGSIWVLLECGFMPGASQDNRYGAAENKSVARSLV
nr:DUF805 domain-containing protein [uncultured Dongia sp.]